MQVRLVPSLIALALCACAHAPEIAAEASSPLDAAPLQDEPRWSTTIGNLTIDGTTFEDVRSTCGMFEVMAVLGAIRPPVHRCVERGPSPTVRVTLESGRATEVSGEGPVGRCISRALRRGRHGGASCRLEFRARRASN